jgi:hypothetical protein
MNLADQLKDLNHQSEKLRSRLINWKFKSAMLYKDVFSDDVEALEVLETLDRMFENSGWQDGDMATIVGVAVDMLLGRF